jgi:hypothetical protein
VSISVWSSLPFAHFLVFAVLLSSL